MNNSALDLTTSLQNHNFNDNFNLREEEENNLPQMKKFFFSYVSLNSPYVAQLCASNLAKHIKKITFSFGVDYFLPLP